MAAVEGGLGSPDTQIGVRTRLGEGQVRVIFI